MEARTELMLSAAIGDLTIAAQLMVEETAKVVASQDHVALIRHFAKVREIESLVKEAKDAIGKLEDNISRSYIPDEFKRVGIKTTNVIGIGRVTVAYRWACSIQDGMKPDAFDWLRNTGNGGIIIETINSGTLAAFAKSEVEEKGKELPAEFFKTSLNPFTSITKV